VERGALYAAHKLGRAAHGAPLCCSGGRVDGHGLVTDCCMTVEAERDRVLNV
jgi:hypothetical protein